jgi:hypothetical protein
LVAAVAALAFGSTLRIWAYYTLLRMDLLLFVWNFSRGWDFTRVVVYKTLYLSFFLLDLVAFFVIWGLLSLLSLFLVHNNGFLLYSCFFII